jgi:ATP-dependent DNA helicase RecG
MRETNDGFKIAERDLALRGPGDVFGTRQTGDLMFKVADLMRDSYLLGEVQKVAKTIMAEYPTVASAVVARWLDARKEYGKV